MLDVNKFNLVLMTPCKNYSYSLGDHENFWTSSAFDRNKKTVILITGWLTNANNGQLPILECISDAYLCRDDVNFIVSLMSNETLSVFYETVYSSSWTQLST